MTDHDQTLNNRTEPDLIDGDVGAKKLPIAPRFERLAILVAVCFQLVVLVGMILGKTVPYYFHGKTVLLQVVPVDPRDLFRGDYVTLGYDISRVSLANFHAGEPVGLRASYLTPTAATSTRALPRSSPRPPAYSFRERCRVTDGPLTASSPTTSKKEPATTTKPRFVANVSGPRSLSTVRAGRG